MKRMIEIGTRGIGIHLKNRRLVICRQDEELTQVPVEDIGIVVLDSSGITISTGALKALLESGAVILACDDTHHPVGLFQPLQGNSLHGERIRLQANMSAPLKKNLWARLVRQKIVNQAAVLPPGPPRERVLALAASVKSGDAGHCESQASRIYWAHVFADLPGVDHPFRRHRNGPPPNAILNYGYAVVRASIARAICSAGLHAGLGIHHRNRYNSFCLADDLIEPYRPFVDLVTREIVLAGVQEVNKESKSMLLGLLTRQVAVNDKSLALDLAVEKTAASLAKAIVACVKERRAAPVAADMLLLPAVSRAWIS